MVPSPPSPGTVYGVRFINYLAESSYLGTRTGPAITIIDLLRTRTYPTEGPSLFSRSVRWFEESAGTSQERGKDIFV